MEVAYLSHLGAGNEPEHPLLHDGGRREARLRGQRRGPPLVMSATWLTHLEHQWRSLAWRPWLDAFSGEHTLLRYDSRGCGLSDRDARRSSFETWVSRFRVRDRCGGFRAVRAGGTCQGGPIAIEYAARHPERVSHLVLYGTYARGRLRRSDSRKRPKRRACCSSSRGWAGDRRTTPSCRCGPHRFSRAARWSICVPGADQQRAGDLGRDRGAPAAGSAGTWT